MFSTFTDKFWISSFNSFAIPSSVDIKQNGMNVALTFFVKHLCKKGVNNLPIGLQLLIVEVE